MDVQECSNAFLAFKINHWVSRKSCQNFPKYLPTQTPTFLTELLYDFNKAAVDKTTSFAFIQIVFANEKTLPNIFHQSWTVNHENHIQIPKRHPSVSSSAQVTSCCLKNSNDHWPHIFQQEFLQIILHCMNRMKKYNF